MGLSTNPKERKTTFLSSTNNHINWTHFLYTLSIRQESAYENFNISSSSWTIYQKKAPYLIVYLIHNFPRPSSTTPFFFSTGLGLVQPQFFFLSTKSTKIILNMIKKKVLCWRTVCSRTDIATLAMMLKIMMSYYRSMFCTKKTQTL